MKRRHRSALGLAGMHRREAGMDHFTPLSAAIGGALIGLAATLLWAANGRTAGISTIAGAIFPIRRGDVLWRIVFLLGLPVGGYLGSLAGPTLLSEIPSTTPVIDLSSFGLIAA